MARLWLLSFAVAVVVVTIVGLAEGWRRELTEVLDDPELGKDALAISCAIYGDWFGTECADHEKELDLIEGAKKAAEIAAEEGGGGSGRLEEEDTSAPLDLGLCPAFPVERRRPTCEAPIPVVVTAAATEKVEEESGEAAAEPEDGASSSWSALATGVIERAAIARDTTVDVLGKTQNFFSETYREVRNSANTAAAGVEDLIEHLRAPYEYAVMLLVAFKDDFLYYTLALMLVLVATAPGGAHYFTAVSWFALVVFVLDHAGVYEAAVFLVNAVYWTGHYLWGHPRVFVASFSLHGAVGLRTLVGLSLRTTRVFVESWMTEWGRLRSALDWSIATLDSREAVMEELTSIKSDLEKLVARQRKRAPSSPSKVKTEAPTKVKQEA